MQQELIAANDPRRVGARQRALFGGRDVAAEGVVVEQEQRSHPRGAARALPNRVGILGGEHIQAPAQLHQVAIAPLPAQLQRVVRQGPQLVVARYPDDRVEAFAQQSQSPLDILAQLAHVPAHDQPIRLGERSQAFHDAAILGVGDVQVADREQAAGTPSRAVHAGDHTCPRDPIRASARAGTRRRELGRRIGVRVPSAALHTVCSEVVSLEPRSEVV
jgi:hypothetical protein